MKTIIYFSGYGGHNSKKFQILKDYFKKCNVIEFAQSYNFSIDTEKLKKIINQHSSNLFFISSSLGCIPGLYSAFLYNKDILLINPSFFPEETLKDCLKKSELNELMIFKDRIIDMLQTKEIKTYIDLYLANDDERISKENRENFKNIFQAYIKHIDESEVGGHAYDIIDKKLKNIDISIYRKEISMEDFFQIDF
jgi:predicted esterase YcpF (UPF0227 family)